MQPEVLEIWGGVEYTRNRVGDTYFDQMDLSGHADRVEDIERIAQLGIRTLRTGLLWENHARDPEWQWRDARMAAIERAGIRPIAGLMHHGSGPAHTSLVDPDFPGEFARYAGEVAERYPWISMYTPVNEPHTTARFSCMYGIWYPHHRSRKSLLEALLNQVKATVLAMREIRRVRPDARLVQTDDFGCIWSTPELLGKCWQMSERRWFALDLLCGRVDRFHPLFTYAVNAGISAHELMWFADHPCPPDVIGLNYYLTSDRFLDHRVELYPQDRRSAEGPFVDVEAVRVRPEGIAGFEQLLCQVWKRYKIPVAITEVHLGGSVDDQIRWAAEAWEGAQGARRTGVQCEAMTVWALFGSYFWNSLVTRNNGHYEPGVFDLRSGTPQETSMAALVRQISRGLAPSHPALGEPGWWRRPDRIHFLIADEIAA